MTNADYGTMPIKKLILRLAIPSIITMLVGSLNMVVDGIFMGNFIGSDALAAVNLVMPIAMIAFSLMDMVGIGSSVRISVLLGEGKEDEASRIFTASSILIFIISLILTALSLIFGETLIRGFIDDENLANLAYDYVRVFIWGLPIIAPLYAFDNYLTVCGKVNRSMYVNITVSAVNIALNTIFIGVLGLGISYAALASVIGMGIGSLILICSFLGKKLPLKFTKPKVSFKDMGMVIFNGSSEFFGNISGSVMAIVTNAIMMYFAGANGVAAISVVTYIEMLLMPVLAGIIVSTQPAVSYNFGAKNYARTKEIFTFVSIISAIICAISVAIMFIFPDFLVSLFSSDGDVLMREIARTGLLLYAPSYLFAWFNFSVSSLLTAFEKAKESVILTLLESVIFPLIFFAVFAFSIGRDGIFLAQSVSALATFFVALRMFKKITVLKNL